MPEIPTADECEDVLLSCRHGDLDDVRQFVDKHGAAALAHVRDANANTVLHMVCANGHDDLLAYLLALRALPPALLSAPNAARSTPLHWAALNAHLGAAQRLVRHPAGPGAALVDARNAAGRTPLGEAELAGWDEGARWLVEVMDLEGAPRGKQGEDEDAGGVGVEERMDPSAEKAETIEVEIQDAEGQVARMSIGGGAK